VTDQADTTYRRWLSGEGIDVLPGQYVPDLRDVPLRPWARMGGSGCFITHEQSDQSNDCYLLEVPPGAELRPQRHLHEVMIYVLSGRGSTSVWHPDAGPQSFEWHAGSLFAIPLNARYQHFNGSGTEPARLFGVTNAPVVLNLFADPGFVFGCDYDFAARYAGEAGYFDGSGTLDGRVWESNFIPDVRSFELLDYSERGAGGRNIRFQLARNTMAAHISQFPVGTYKMAHRHVPGAHVIVLNGTGYTLMWKEGEEPRRYDWHAGSLVIPPGRTFHQHFNTGAEPARYLALRHRNGVRDPKTGLPMSSISIRLGGDQIDYADEDPKIRATYAEECARGGVTSRMDQFFDSPGEVR
jgi:mannose-6-phosphate isomerase-like protein (cupin superfamily)/oxalate decarboxylase/phosphoglucose isomerase-like protein (cupin superfamily)